MISNPTIRDEIRRESKERTKKLTVIAGETAELADESSEEANIEELSQQIGMNPKSFLKKISYASGKRHLSSKTTFYDEQPLENLSKLRRPRFGGVYERRIS